MKIFKLLIIVCTFYSSSLFSQAIQIEIVNTSITPDNLSWSFDIVATANAGYIPPTDNNWSGMSVRFDLAVGNNNISGGVFSVNSMFALNGSVITSVPGIPPGGSSELGLSITRNGQTDLTIGIPTTLGSFTVNFNSPVMPSNLVTPRTGTTSSGSFWSNPTSGSRPFGLPAPFPLPIKIKTFDVVKDGDRSSKLNWVSSSEINSDYFGVERSKDGRTWETIGKVNAAGNSNTDIAYEYFDRNLPMTRNSDNIFYYRLKLTDQDGYFKYSDIRGVNFGKVSGDVISIYPNPTYEVINVDLSGMDMLEGDIHLSVFDNAGRSMIQKNITGNGIELIEVNQYPAGTYNVMVKQGDTVHQKKIIKIN